MQFSILVCRIRCILSWTGSRPGGSHNSPNGRFNRILTSQRVNADALFTVISRYQGMIWISVMLVRSQRTSMPRSLAVCLCNLTACSSLHKMAVAAGPRSKMRLSIRRVDAFSFRLRVCTGLLQGGRGFKSGLFPVFLCIEVLLGSASGWLSDTCAKASKSPLSHACKHTYISYPSVSDSRPISRNPRYTNTNMHLAHDYAQSSSDSLSL
jgi:hypothetical protein